VALSSIDDKKHVLPNKTDTLALGHCRLNTLLWTQDRPHTPNIV